MPLVELTGFLGCNLKQHRRFLPPGVGVSSTNQKPSEEGDFRPWAVPLAVSPAPNVPADRISLYRMGRDAATPATHWLSWTTFVQAIRGFDSPDSTERTYYTGSGTPKWTDNILALGSAPYPAGNRELAVPQPTIAPGVTVSSAGVTGDDRRVWYCFTWVNDIGWESAPSPPTLAPLCKADSVLDLTISESVPAGNYGVTLVRWYRTQTYSAEGDAEFFFLREYAEGAAGMQDPGTIVLGTDVLPTGVENLRLRLPTDASWLTYCWNSFAAAIVGKTVRMCEPELIYAWPLANEYPLASTPKALAAFAQRLLVFTTDGAEVLTGTEPGAMDQKPMALAPIVAPRSLVVGESWCAWAAADGLYFYGVEGYRNLVGDILTPAQWSALVPATMHCHYLQVGTRPLIIGFYNDGALKGFVVDPANPAGMYFLSTGYPAAYWDKLLRKLFVLEGSTLMEWDAGASFMTATFKSKVHRQVEHAEAEWLELLASGAATVKVYTEQAGATDDATALVERMSRVVTRGVHRVNDGTGGRDFQCEVSTMGSVQGLALE